MRGLQVRNQQTSLVQTGLSGRSWGALGNNQIFPGRFTNSLAESNEFAELYLVPGKQCCEELLM